MSPYQTLKKGQLLTFENQIDAIVISGEIWVTLENDQKDYVLKAGEHISFDHHGKIVIESLEKTDLLFAYSLQDTAERRIAAQAGNLA